MSYVEHCKKHGQHHGEICGECFEDLKVENTRLREALQSIVNSGPASPGDKKHEIARAALVGE
jgi:hypothetical protein